MLPNINNIRVNTHLTNISVAYAQNAAKYIADKVFPVVPVAQPDGTYTSYPLGDWFRVENHVRAPGTESAGGGFRYDIKSFRTDVRAFHKDIDDQTRAAATTPFNLDRDSVAYVTDNLLLGREQEWAQAYFRAGVWGTDVTGVTATPGAGQFLSWKDDSSDPVNDIRSRITLREAVTGLRPNVGVISQSVLDRLVNHPDIIERRKYTTANNADLSVLAALFGLDRIVVASAVQNTAKEGQTANIGFVFSDSMLLAYANPQASTMSVSAGYIFAWTGYTGGGYGAGIKRFRMEPIESERVEGSMAYGMNVVAPDLGIFFASVLA